MGGVWKERAHKMLPVNSKATFKDNIKKIFKLVKPLLFYAKAMWQLLTRSNITGVVSAQSCLPLTEAVGLRTSSLLAKRKRLCLSASLSSLCFLQALNDD